MNGCITIYTDASVCAKTATGGWSCWIKAAPGETSLHSGAMKDPVRDSTEAEMKAIANALVVAKKVYSPEGKIIVVVTDSLEAIHCIEGTRISTKMAGKRRKRCDHLMNIAKNIRDLVPEGCELRVNKVKAHSKSDGVRSYVNNLVDTHARAAMKRKRNGGKANDGKQ